MPPPSYIDVVGSPQATRSSNRSHKTYDTFSDQLPSSQGTSQSSSASHYCPFDHSASEYSHQPQAHGVPALVQHVPIITITVSETTPLSQSAPPGLPLPVTTQNDSIYMSGDEIAASVFSGFMLALFVGLIIFLFPAVFFIILTIAVCRLFRPIIPIMVVATLVYLLLSYLGDSLQPLVLFLKF
jgi:hypothetical protein